MKAPREFWISEHRIAQCDCIVEGPDPMVDECFGPFQVVEKSAYEAALARIEKLREALRCIAMPTPTMPSTTDLELSMAECAQRVLADDDAAKPKEGGV